MRLVGLCMVLCLWLPLAALAADATCTQQLAEQQILVQVLRQQREQTEQDVAKIVALLNTTRQELATAQQAAAKPPGEAPTGEAPKEPPQR